MTAAAPAMRTVCQLTGQVAERPSKFFDAMTTADTYIDELTNLRAEVADAHTTIEGLQAELDELRRAANWAAS